MAIDFTLTDGQKKLQKTAREFAKKVLDPVVRDADREPDPQRAFAVMKTPYVEAYRLGLAMGFQPKPASAMSTSKSLPRKSRR